jgi:antitoxin component of RelBE/YafQ-DinJ toxin-antitoxin module
VSGRGRPPIGARVEVRLDESVRLELDEYAARIGATRAELVRMILERWADTPGARLVT